MNYIQITPYDIANGPGVRTVLWVSGCGLGCPGCHNPHTHDPYAGQPFDWDALEELLTALRKPYVQGLTFSGGHPLEEYNLASVYNIIRTVKQTLPNKDIWLYTGYKLTYNDFIANDLKGKIISSCDVVVDGPYIQEQRDISLLFRGSRNQRLINVKQTLEKGEIIVC